MCGNPFIVMNFGHHRTNSSCHVVGEKHLEQRENAHAREIYFNVFLKGNKYNFHKLLLKNICLKNYQ